MVILSTQNISDEVLNTVLIQAEEILNNRPITKLSEDPNDCSILRPSDLIHAIQRDPSPTVSVFSPDLYNKGWRQAQYMTELFWSKWMRYYLPELQGRQKWRKEKHNLKFGDVVLVVDMQNYRNYWPLGLVIQATQDDDGLVRTVKLRSCGKEIIRAINKVVLLESSLNE